MEKEHFNVAVHRILSFAAPQQIMIPEFISLINSHHRYKELISSCLYPQTMNSSEAMKMSCLFFFFFF